MRLFVKNVFPMVFDLTINGFLFIMDGIFIGLYVGANGMAAVSIAFPMTMIITALSALVNGGMSSLFTRALGAKKIERAEALFVSAHGLAITISLFIVGVFLISGHAIIDHLVHGNQLVSEMAYLFLLITILASPIQFLRGIHSNAMRNEGFISLAAISSIIVALVNIVLNYFFIKWMGWGVAGSAIGTALAQVIALCVLVVIRQNKSRLISLTTVKQYRFKYDWLKIVILGAPLSLSFLGMAVGSFTVIMVLRTIGGDSYLDLVASYGVVSRAYGFAYLPLMGIGLATQSLIGHNIGARFYHRSDTLLIMSLSTVLVYCSICEGIFQFAPERIAALFVVDSIIVTQVVFILRVTSVLYFSIGPVLILGLYFQVIGQSRRASLLTLSKSFLFLPGLVIIFGHVFKSQWVWYSLPVADSFAAIVAGVVVCKAIKRRSFKYGIGL